MGLHEKVFGPLVSPLNTTVHWVSVFGRFDPKDHEGVIRVQYSGEPYAYPCEWFHVNLTHNPDDPDKRNVCFPLFSLYNYDHNRWPLLMTPRELTPKKKFCVFCVSNPNALVRNRMFEALSRYKQVDSCGGFMNNMGTRAPREEDAYLSFLKDYKFMICFENNQQDCYITEKISDAYCGGTVPIYWGARRALTWLNPKAFLYLEDEAGIPELVQRVIELDQNDDLYEAVYREPLLLDGIPKVLSLERAREGMHTILRKHFVV